MANLQELFSILAKRAGLPDDDTLIVSLKENEALKAIDVPVTTNNIILSNLFNAQQAKENPKIKQHFTDTIWAESMGTIDAVINPVIDELGDEAIDVKQETKTAKKITALLEKVKTIESKKAGATTGEKAKLQEKIDALNAQVVAERKNWTAEKESIINKYESTITDTLHDVKLRSYKLAKDEKIPAEVRYATAKMLVQSDLQKRGVMIKNIDGELTLTDKDGNPYTENNEKVGYHDFVDKCMSASGLLEVSGAPATPTQQQFIQPQIIQPANQRSVTSAAIDEALAAFK